ncbi:EAL domain-containing protein [Alteromonas sp. S167]|uniref:EAL domain-containing protein n=1 Tax=Alteromonas sp. S167 TaxID=3117402 RepID=UPI002FE42B20
MPIREISEEFSVNDIVPYFQPIIDLDSSGVWRYECLARLITQGDKTFLPSEFLYLIEREHHISALAASMFVQCAHYFHDLNIPWNFNITSNDLQNEQLTNTLITHLASYPNPERVSTEVSASTALSNPQQLASFIDKSMHAGLGVFIDNVGSCPGNIRALMNIPVRGIKLAGGLIRHYDDQDAVREYVDYVLNLCEQHGVNVIAEHIEDEAQLERVKRLPIRYAQGYVFSPPVASVKRAQQPH